MKLLLRVISVLTVIAILWTLLFVIRFYLAGGIPVLMTDMRVALPTMFGWLMTLLLGPFAAVQLWRLRNSGRVATLLLVTYSILYYSYGLLLSRQLGSQITSLLSMIFVNLLILIILVLPATKKKCVNRGLYE